MYGVWSMLFFKIVQILNYNFFEKWWFELRI
jgi:hypothetical protein